MSIKKTKPTYVYASCKPWHSEIFRLLSSRKAEKWIYVSCPRSLNSVLAKYQPRYIFFPHWSWIVPSSIWEKYECVCFHMTDLPHGRGGSPLQNLILAGHRKTKISALRMTKEVDAGPVYMKRNLSLQGRAEDIYRRSAKICGSMMLRMVKFQPGAIPQKGRVTKFRRRKPSESRLPKIGTLLKWYDWIRMLDAFTYPKAFLDYGNFRIEFDSVVARKKGLEANVVITQGGIKK